jgi:hypothetical protein
MSEPVIPRDALLGYCPSPAWRAAVAVLCPGDAAHAVDVLGPVLAQVRRVAPAGALPALDVASRALADGSLHLALRDASAELRAAYELEAPPIAAGTRRTREAHADRWRRPWVDPCGDPAELRPLAASVDAVYAVEGWASSKPASLTAYYLRAAWEWSAATEETAR